MDRIYTYKVTLNQQFKLLSSLLFVSSFISAGLIYFIGISFLFDKAAQIVLSVFFVIDTLPTLSVHFQYLKINGGYTLIINRESKILTYENNKKKLQYSFDQIEELNYYRSYAKGGGWHSFAEYRYYTIKFKDGVKINVTCLLVNDIQNILDNILNIEAKKHLKFLALVY